MPVLSKVSWNRLQTSGASGFVFSTIIGPLFLSFGGRQCQWDG